MASISEIAESANSKALYFKAAQTLPREDYLRFMLMAADQVGPNGISKQQFKWGLFPSAKHLREMWLEDPPGELLKDLARRASREFADDPKLLEFFDGLESGEVLAEAKKFKERYYGPSADSRPPRSGTHDGQAEKSSEEIEQGGRFAKILWMVIGISMVALVFFLFRHLKRTDS